MKRIEDEQTEERQAKLRRVAKRVVMFVLIGLAVITFVASLYPAFAIFPLLFLAAALGVHYLVRVDDVRKATEEARQLGASGPITYAGKIVHLEGACPSGIVMHEDDEFGIADGRIWPRLCPHAERAIFDAIPHMNENPNPLAAPIHFNDGAHEFDIDLHDVREESRAA